MVNNTLFGIKVLVNDEGTHAPKIQVSPDFKWITDDARRDMNLWLAQRFGYSCQVLKMKTMDGEEVLILCSHAMAKLKAELSKSKPFGILRTGGA